MRKHISQVVSTCFFHLRRLRPLRARLSREQRQRLVSAIILSRVDYCNVVLAGLPASSLAPLQRVLNAAARFVADLHPRDHVTGTLRDLHWLPIRTRITYKLCTLMHASVHGVAPVYIWNMLTSVTELPGRSHLRSAASGLYDVPRTRNEIWDQIVLGCRTDCMECSATRAARNRWLCVFPEKTENFSFHPGLWSWPWFTLLKLKLILILNLL